MKKPRANALGFFVREIRVELTRPFGHYLSDTTS